jgi:hypothetical protein
MTLLNSLSMDGNMSASTGVVKRIFEANSCHAQTLGGREGEGEEAEWNGLSGGLSYPT